MATAEHTAIDVREVTPDEVAQFERDGWALLRDLISPAAAAELLAEARRTMGERGDGATNAAEDDRFASSFAKWYNLDRDSGPFRALRTSRQLGRNAALLWQRDMPIRSLTSTMAVKLAVDVPIERGKGVTDWHQDQGNTPARCMSMGFWFALDEITPEMGAMRFHSGSHRLGWLYPPVEDWEIVQRLPLSEPFHLLPGDATVHSSLVVHGAPANTTNRSRWAYIVNCFPGDAPHLPYPTSHTEGLEGELEAGKPMDNPRFPLLYTPAG